MGSAVLLPASFAVLLAGALLFTNAIEWLGVKLSLGQGAVGSTLAAVATAVQESLIPVVAIIGVAAGSDDVAPVQRPGDRRLGEPLRDLRRVRRSDCVTRTRLL